MHSSAEFLDNFSPQPGLFEQATAQTAASEKPVIGKLRKLAISSLPVGVALLGATLLAGCAHPAYYPPPPPVAPSAIFQQGVHDGFEAARNDVANGRPPNFAHHPRYRNPPVPPPAFADYRHGFRQGYEQFLHQGPPPPRPGY